MAQNQGLYRLQKGIAKKLNKAEGLENSSL